MFTEEAKRILRSAGYDCEGIEVNKNGCKYTGLRIISERDVNPIIYIDDIDDGDDLLDAVTYAMNQSIPDISFDPETVYAKVRIGIAKEVAPDIICRKRKYHGMVVYLYIMFDKRTTAKLPQSLLNDTDFTERKLWGAAKRNTFANTLIMPFMIPGSFIVTNEEFSYGAASIIDSAALKERVKSGKYYVCPSSVHEMLLIPADGYDLEGMSEIVRQVNFTVVDPHERLIDEAFVLEV